MNTFSEGKLIRLKLKTYGYERGRVPLEFDYTLKCVAHALIGLPENTAVKGYRIATSDIVPKAKGIMEKYFKLHDISYISDEGFTTILQGISVGDVTSVDSERLNEIKERVEGMSETISPFDLPLDFIPGHFMVGEIKKPIILLDDEDFLKSQRLLFSKITLGDNATLLSSATAAHEYTHSQLESVRGSCKHYHNREVLPIFMEKLAVLELDPSGKLLEISSRMRNRDLFENIAVLSGGLDNFSRTELVESSVYVNSILQANALFDRYINGSDDVQGNILNGIQAVFDGESTVEALLDNMGVNFENSAKAAMVKKF